MTKLKTPAEVQKLETARDFAKYVKDQPGVVVTQEDECGITFQAGNKTTRMSNDRYPLNPAEKQSFVRALAQLGLLAIVFLVALAIVVNVAAAGGV